MKQSIQAKNVALDVISKVGKGIPINKEKIAIKNGYSVTSARAGKVLQTDTYKETIETFVKKLEKERARLLTELSNRDISSERYSTLIDAMDKITKNTQLLTGKATENIATQVQVVRYEDKVAEPIVTE